MGSGFAVLRKMRMNTSRNLSGKCSPSICVRDNARVEGFGGPGWKQATGALRDVVCRALLLMLQRAGPDGVATSSHHPGLHGPPTIAGLGALLPGTRSIFWKPSWTRNGFSEPAYWAADWVVMGEPRGRKDDQTHRPHQSIKDVLALPLSTRVFVSCCRRWEQGAALERIDVSTGEMEALLEQSTMGAEVRPANCRKLLEHQQPQWKQIRLSKKAGQRRMRSKKKKGSARPS